VALKCFGETIAHDGSYALHHDTFGWNYRANILSLAVASQQLFRVDGFNALRRESAKKIDNTLNSIPGFSPPVVPKHAQHVYHMYRFRFEPARAGLAVSADQAREALKAVFNREGLPLVEFQNTPLPGHALLQQRVGYGRGCPWACHHRSDMVYRIEDFPGALDAIRHSLVIGLPAQAVLANEEVVDAYIRCFQKVHHNLRAFERFAASFPSLPPWHFPPRIF
jgi:dTDP-4-amino-4,6-dideoxygalactose transaminase